MKKFKKILLWAFGVFLFLVGVLAVHIYYVYRPKADAYTKIMARIDIKQQLTQNDADKINAWMYHQKGIDHVLVNPQTNIVIFTFYPLKTTGDKIAGDFKKAFSYPSERFKPSQESMNSGCPVAATAFTYKVYKFIAQII